MGAAVATLDPIVSPVWFDAGDGKRRTLLSPGWVLTCLEIRWRPPGHSRRTVYVDWWLHRLDLDEDGVTETEVAFGSAPDEGTAIVGARLIVYTLPEGT